MELLLIRHGNTFLGTEKAVWVGRQDLELTEEGKDQARMVGRYLAAHNIALAGIYCAPLLRTVSTANVIVEELGGQMQPVVDSRLTEIDYGAWSGLTSEQVAERFGSRMLEAWNDEGRWPPPGVWNSRREEIEAGVEAFTREARARHGKKAVVAAVSSNGCIRCFLPLIRRQDRTMLGKKGLKVRTGAVCRLAWEAEAFTVLSWDERPAAFSHE